MKNQESQTQQLVEFLLTDHAFPEGVMHEAKRALLGFYAAAFSGVASPIWAAAGDAMATFSPQGHHVALGSQRRWAAQDAAFLNAVAGNVLDYDDTHLPTIIHPSSMVVPVLWARAEQHRLAGDALLKALVLSFEVMCRVGNATHPDSYKRGFHVTATCGAIGAAVATALLDGFKGAAMQHVIGLSANLGAGLIANLATPAKAVSVGNAVRHGMLVPRFVEAGITASATALEGTFGFLQAMSDSGDPEALVQGLGRNWQIMQVAQKPYPTGVVLNPVIDACLALRQNPLVDASAIERVEVFGHSLLKDRADRAVVKSVPDARLSVQHTVAVTLLQGLPSVRSFHETAYADATVKRLGERVTLAVDNRLDVEAARVRIVTTRGEALESTIAQGRGSLANPLSDRDLEEKLANSVRETFPQYDPTGLIRQIWTLDGLENAAELFACLPKR